MKASEIYRRAAELQDTGQYSSCYAVNEAVTGDARKPTKEAQKYAALFSPRENHDPDESWGLEWADNPWFWGVNECRVLALCFMAAIAADEERAKRARGR